jgi:hypothetical protein
MAVIERQPPPSYDSALDALYDLPPAPSDDLGVNALYDLPLPRDDLGVKPQPPTEAPPIEEGRVTPLIEEKAESKKTDKVATRKLKVRKHKAKVAPFQVPPPQALEPSEKVMVIKDSNFSHYGSKMIDALEADDTDTFIELVSKYPQSLEYTSPNKTAVSTLLLRLESIELITATVNHYPKIKSILFEELISEISDNTFFQNRKNSWDPLPFLTELNQLGLFTHDSFLSHPTVVRSYLLSPKDSLKESCFERLITSWGKVSSSILENAALKSSDFFKNFSTIRSRLEKLTDLSNHQWKGFVRNYFEQPILTALKGNHNSSRKKTNFWNSIDKGEYPFYRTYDHYHFGDPYDHGLKKIFKEITFNSEIDKKALMLAYPILPKQRWHDFILPRWAKVNFEIKSWDSYEDFRQEQMRLYPNHSEVKFY